MLRLNNEQVADNIALVGEAPVAENQAVDVAIAGARAYVVALEGGVTVFDITDRAKPLRLSHIPSLERRRHRREGARGWLHLRRRKRPRPSHLQGAAGAMKRAEKLLASEGTSAR